MTDTAKLASRNQYPVSDSIPLRFPTIPVNKSLVEWLAQSDSFNMKSKQAEKRYDHAVVPMEDSFYGIVEPCSTLSDDEASTNSAFSSYEDETEDEGNVFTNDRSAITVKGKESDPSHSFSDLEQGCNAIEGHAQGNDVVSGHCRDTGLVPHHSEDKSPPRTIYSQGGNTRYITLHETAPATATGLIDAACPIHSIYGDRIKTMSANTGQMSYSKLTIVGGSLCQTMVREPTELPKPYTVLYVGGASSKDSIMEKIGSAIAASEKVFDPSSKNAPSSDFSIHPVSASADGTCSNALLVPSTGFVLSTQECKFASVVREGKRRDELHLRSSGTTHIIPISDVARWTPPNNWRLPDLTIFCIPKDNDRSAQEVRRFIRLLMNRLAIPCILITQTALPENIQEHFDLDLRTPHFSIDCSGSGMASYHVRKQPIDLPTFLELDASQMNRNLACLARTHGNSSSQGGKWSWKSGNMRKKVGIFIPSMSMKYLRTLTHGFARPNLATALSTIIILFTLGACWQNSWLFQGASSSVGVAMPAASKTGGSTAMVYPSLNTSTISKASTTQLPLSIQAPVHKSVSIVHSNTNLASLLLNAQYLIPNNSEKFQVRVIGDSHILLRPPQWLVRSRKNLKLLFNVTHGSVVLKHSVSTLFEGVIALKLEREDARGMVNITIWTNSKPRLNETFQVYFGTPWLNIAGWKIIGLAVTDSIHEDLGAVQNGLSFVYDRTSLELRSLVRNATSMAKIVREEAKKIGAASVYQTTRTTDLVLAQTTGYTHGLVQKLRKRNAKTTKQLSVQIDGLRKNMAIYARDRLRMISRSASRLHRAASSLDSREFTSRLRARRAASIRNTQKRAMKLWWKLVGLPNKEVERCTLCRPPLKTYRRAKKGNKR